MTDTEAEKNYLLVVVSGLTQEATSLREDLAIAKYKASMWQAAAWCAAALHFVMAAIVWVLAWR